MQHRLRRNLLGFHCDHTRGPTDCVGGFMSHKCICKPGFCGENGRCVAAPEEPTLLMEVRNATAESLSPVPDEDVMSLSSAREQETGATSASGFDVFMLLALA